MLGTSEVFVRSVSKKGSLNEGLECGGLSPATIVMSLEPNVWVVFHYVIYCISIADEFRWNSRKSSSLLFL